jgi:DNA-directed RNA polymerase subunit RPC12/RpoP
MSHEQERKKAIMSGVEKLVDEAMRQGQESLTLEAIEEIALKARDEMARSLTEQMVQQQAAHQTTATDCPDCGKRMSNKGKKKRYVRTRSGEVQIERPYFYCAGCQRGHFPPG